MFREGNIAQDTTGLKIDALLLKAGFINPKSDSSTLVCDSTLITISSEITNDTLPFCPRNAFASFPFADSITNLKFFGQPVNDGFPYILVNTSKQLKDKHYTLLKKQLREGANLQVNNIYSDWILGIILISAFFFALVRSTSRSLFQSIFKTVIMKGFRTENSRDIGGLFHWQSTLLNLASFLNIGLFIYFIQNYYNLIQVSFPQILLWFGFFLIIVIAITLRHLVCHVTGTISGEKEAFREYLFGIYQIYRLFGIILFIFNILISYTTFPLPTFYFTTGLIIIAILYLLRVLRLIIIFINRHIPIFYLILYLCALEILPAVVLFKFLTGSN
jgi:hypothetical protein